MLDWRSIDYLHWQPKRGALGEALFGYLDPLQAVRAIALTEKGTCPLHPEKCVRLVPWIDQPENIARPNMARELWDAVTTYEPRVVMQRVEFQGAEYSHWRALLSVVLAGDVEKRIHIVEVPIGAA
ncbi:hypothetical protein [Methylocystis sp. S23]